MSGFISLDYQNRIPIYEQIVNEIERFVALGILKPGEQIPAIREMASDLGINPNTVKKAYTELERKGVIMTISTRGTYIANNTEQIIKDKITQGVEEIKSKMDELMKLGVSKEDILNWLKE